MPEWPSDTRRRFLRALGALGGATLAAPFLRSTSARAVEAERQPAGGEPPSPVLKPGSETILILLYPGFTAMDAIGPEYVLSGMAGASVRFVAKTRAPVRSESGFEVSPAIAFGDCPAKPDLLIVPGGMDGTLAAMQDAATLDFLRRVGGAAAMAGSVCTGSLLLGAAGLLDGYEAASHWQTLGLLPLAGARPSSRRVVIDRNRVTGAGVTAGLDFALELVKFYRGDFYARGMQLLAQYDPRPPFPGGGDPKTADPEVVALLTEMHEPFIERAAAALRAVRSGG